MTACAGGGSGGTGGNSGSAGSAAAGSGSAGTTGAGGAGQAGQSSTGGTTGAGGAGNPGAAGSGVGGSAAGSGGTAGAGSGGAQGAAGNAGGGSGGATGSGGSAGATGSGGSGGGGATGSGGRGGQGGTAGSSGGGNGGGSGCPAGAVLCDDFEAGTVGQAPSTARWTLSLNGNGTIQIDNAQAHGGTKSMHVNGMSAFHTMAMATGVPLFPLPAGVLYGRTWLRLGTDPGQGHSTWIEAGAVMNDVAETRIGSNLGAMDINRWPGDTEQRAPGTKLQTGMWYCVEFMFDKTANEARVWLGGQELTDLHVTNWVAPNPQNGNNTNPIQNWAPDYQAVRFGWELNGGSIWFDDIALGYSRINCQ